MGNRVATLGFALASVSLVACGGSGKKSKGPNDVAGIGETDGITVPRVDPSLCDTKGKTIRTFDLNRDNRPDVWKLFAQSEEGGTTVEILTCKQVDLDHDGRKDYVQTYSRTGEILAEEFDFTFEGSMDAREHYDKKTGKIYLIERDTDHDKKPDVWEMYRKGRLERMGVDLDGDERVTDSMPTEAAPDLSEKTPPLQMLASSWRLRFAVGMVLAVFLGFAAAHVTASAREDQKYSELRKDLEAEYKAATSIESWNALDEAKEATIKSYESRQKNIVITSLAIWMAVGGLFLFAWSRLIKWDRVAKPAS